METMPRPGRTLPMAMFAPVPDLDPVAYDRLAVDVRSLLGIDLTKYKPAQVWRRVNGFATGKGLAGPDALMARAKVDPVLRQAFLDMLTINVSEFFRNPEAWEALADQFLKPLLKSKPSVRVWSAGCSLGYEPFTIAMLAREIAPNTPVSILATDLDETVLSRAKTATYTETQLVGVSPARRGRFFRPNREVGGQARAAGVGHMAAPRSPQGPIREAVRHHLLPERRDLFHRVGQDGVVPPLLRRPSPGRRPVLGRYRIDPQRARGWTRSLRADLLSAAVGPRLGVGNAHGGLRDER
jgi:hypothetical protein